MAVHGVLTYRKDEEGPDVWVRAKEQGGVAVLEVLKDDGTDTPGELLVELGLGRDALWTLAYELLRLRDAL